MEMTSEVIIAGKLLTLVALIILAGAVSSRLSRIIYLPDVVVFILAGAILGPSGLGILSFDNAIVNQVILTFGASYILYDGGREIRLNVLNQIKFSVTVLATVGVLISAVLTAWFAVIFLHLDPMFAFLLGAVIASTDPSVLVPLFKNMNISPKLKQTIIAESAFNDACGAIITFATLGIIAGGAFSVGGSGLELLKTSLGGILIGVIVGFVFLILVADRIHGIFSDFKAELAVASVIGAYQVASVFGFSGFMAVFVFGIVVGNKDDFKLPAAEGPLETHLHFKDALISIIRMMIFILLGLHIDFAILKEYWAGALATVLLFIFVARPVSVFFSVIWDRRAQWTWQEIVYLMWVRETGVIPAALVGMLVTMNVPHADVISSVTFMAIIITLSLQASTKGFLARVLKLESKDAPPEELAVSSER